jgi:hypothetical protein
VRCDSDLHEPRTNAEQSETAGDFRVSHESPQRAPDGRLMYFEHQLQPNPDYRGLLECMSVEEARALFEQMLDRFHIYDWTGFPLPPAGLPGFLHSPYSEDSPEGKLLALGIRYALALVRNERRAMHLRWEDASALIRKIKNDAEEAVYLAQAQQFVKEWEQKEAVPQFVYFIAAEDGPVKIGVATKPKNRLKELQTSHHQRLAILATCDGDVELEKAYHKRFAAHRLSGEWFERSPEIQAEIDRLSSGGVNA